MEGKMTTEARKSAFNRARLLACNSSCERCGKLKKFPDGVASYEELYCETAWLCDECYPDVEGEDDDE